MSDNQVIPEAAVEAAAIAWSGPLEWLAHSDEWRDDRREDARSALAAAAPHIQAQALEDAAYVFEGLPMNKGASISSGTYDWFELFPIQHMRDRAEDIRIAK